MPVNAVSSVGKSQTQTSTTTRSEIYQVKKNDTLSSISQKFGLTIAEFKQWTKHPKDTILLGEKIRFFEFFAGNFFNNARNNYQKKIDYTCENN